MRKFKVGDRVKVREWGEMAKEFRVNSYGNIEFPHTDVICNERVKSFCGKSAIIKAIKKRDDDTTFQLCFDDGSNHFGVIFIGAMLERIEDKKIVIITNGVKTIAKLYEQDTIIKTAIARCSPDDTYDFKIGAKLAMDRLIGTEDAVKKTTFIDSKIKCWVLCSTTDTGDVIAKVFANYDDARKQMGYECYTRAAELVKNAYLDETFEVGCDKDEARLYAPNIGVSDLWWIKEGTIEQ